MSRRDSLPNSLELLLDTMCNTFGGIVFIAIALVIITQVAQKVLTATAELRATPEAKQALREQNAQLEQEIEELKAELQEQALAARCSAEKRAKIEALLQTKIDLAAAQAKIDALAEEFAQLQEQKETLQIEMLDLQEQVKTAEEMLAELQRQRKTVQDALGELQKQAEKLKKENRVLEKEIEEAEAQEAFTIAFSMEDSGGSNLTQCVVLLRRGRIYVEKMNLSWRERGSNEVVPEFAGSGYSATPGDLRQALARFNRNGYFIEIWTDKQSFDALVTLRQWLRENQYRVAWHYTDDFRFYTGAGAHNTSF